MKMYGIATIMAFTAAVMLSGCSMGPTGPQGEQGIPGTTGPRGEQGIDGPAGQDYRLRDSVWFHSAKKFTVTPTGDWIATGVRVDMGDEILVKASGTLTTTNGTSGPEGVSSIGGMGHPLVNQSVNALFFRVGNAGAVKAGRSYYGYASDSGIVEVLINCPGPVADSRSLFTIDSLVIFSAR